MITLTTTWYPAASSQLTTKRHLGDREALHWLAEGTLLELCEVVQLRPDAIALRVSMPRGRCVYELVDYHTHLYGLVRIVQAYLAIQIANRDKTAKENLEYLLQTGSIYSTRSWSGSKQSFPAIQLPERGSWRYYPLQAAVVLGLLGDAPGYLRQDEYSRPTQPLSQFLDEVLDASHRPAG